MRRDTTKLPVHSQHARPDRLRRLSLETLEDRALLAGSVGGGASEIFTADLSTIQGPMAVGMNLNNIDYYSPSPVFVDAMKNSHVGWRVVQRSSLNYPFSIQGVAQPAMDPQGYPVGLGGLEAKGYALSTAAFLHNGKHFPVGTYTLIFDGDGTVIVHQSGVASTVDQSGGLGSPHPVNVAADDFGILVSIVRSNPDDHVRNIRLIMPGFESTYQTQPFYPPFLEGLESFSVLRFMDPMKTNGQVVEQWADRTKVDDRTQTNSAGMSVEYMVQLANTLHKDMWVNMPVLAQDDYVQKFARYTRDNLDPGLRIYVEYGNELWNYAPGFYQAYKHVEDYAFSRGIAHDQATADLTKHIWDIWRQEYGQEKGRVQRVVANQFVSPGRFNAEISRLIATSDPDDLNKGFEIISGAPYFGPDSSDYNAATTIQDVLEDGLASISVLGPQLDRFMQMRASWETSLGKKIPVIMYEGGWGLHLSSSATWYPTYLQAQTDPGMYSLTLAYLDMLEAYGVDGLAYYSYLYQAGPYGEWGSKEYADQATDLTPKFNALRDYASAVPPTISDIVVSHHTANGATITWTTSVPSSSVVEYGIGSAYQMTSGLNSTPVTIHSIRLTGLAANSIYHFRVRSARENGLAVVSDGRSFSTDINPPKLTAIGTSNLSTSSVTINWMTSEPTYGRIEFLSASAGKQIAYDSTLSTNHSITLTGLMPGTTYSYQITSTDSATNVVLSDWNTVQTAVLSLPTPLGSTPTAGAPGVMATQGRYAYVASSEAPYNFQVYDVGNAGAPVLMATLATGASYPTSIAVSGNYAYIISIYNGGLLIYDVANPSAPRLVSKSDVGYHPYGISLQGSYAYISHYDSSTAASTLAIYDVSNPLKPIRAGVVPISPLSKSVVIEGHYAYVIGDGSPNFQVFDVSNPHAPFQVGTLQTDGHYQKALAVREHYAYVAYSAASGTGLQIIDISDPTRPVAVAKLVTGTNPKAVLLDGQYLYLLGDTLRVVDVYDPLKPILIGSSVVSGLGLSIEGRYLFTIDAKSKTINKFYLKGVVPQASEPTPTLHALFMPIPMIVMPPPVVVPPPAMIIPAEVPFSLPVIDTEGVGSNVPTPIDDQPAGTALKKRARRLVLEMPLREAVRHRMGPLGPLQHPNRAKTSANPDTFLVHRRRTLGVRAVMQGTAAGHERLIHKRNEKLQVIWMA